jgi:hypothetical protein
MKGTMGDYTIPAVSESPIMDVFPYFSGEEGELLEKFNALKASKPEVAAEIVDHMEFEAALKRSCILRFLKELTANSQITNQLLTVLFANLRFSISISLVCVILSYVF